MSLYVVTYTTESGDHGVVGVYRELPTKAHLHQITLTKFPEEWIDDGNGAPFSLIYYEVKRVDGVAELPVLP